MCVALAAQTQLLDQCLVPFCILAVQIVEQAAARVDEFQQTAAAVVILHVGLEVGGQFVDAGGENGHLHFGAARVAGGARGRRRSATRLRRACVAPMGRGGGT